MIKTAFIIGGMYFMYINVKTKRAAIIKHPKMTLNIFFSSEVLNGLILSITSYTSKLWRS